MWRWATVARLFLLGAVALGVLCCDAPTKSHPVGIPPSAEGDSVEDSGKRLAGDFILTAVDDAYRIANKPSPRQAILSFDENGTLKRQENSRIDEGTYLIGTQGELVIYIEKVNGEPLPGAVSDRFLITNQSGDTIQLETASRKFTLQKR